MNYYEVIPANNSYHGKEPLTYCYQQVLSPGQIVRINLRGKATLGIVVKKVQEPSFKTVNINEPLNLSLPASHLGLMKWMLSYYPAPLGSIALLFVPSFVDKLENLETTGNTKRRMGLLPKLTPEQSQAYRTINKNFSDGQSSFILQGVTGSGKTRLYMELAEDSLDKGKSVLVLTPEISLTAPIAAQFKKAFGDIVVINHSSLTQKQRLSIWGQLFHGDKPIVVIGPRSSLFMPIKDIGLIVVDEFHESAYKQESQPFYHANRVSSVLSRLSAAKLIFGSATPPVMDYFLAEQKNAPIINMKKSAITGQKPLSETVIVDLLDKDQKSVYPLISNALMTSLSETLNQGNQAMLFINKRGSARSISCQDCGYRELCPNCDLPMVYHADQHLVRCHTCGYKKQPPSSCPDCGSFNIFFSSPGTKAIAEVLSKHFKGAKIFRFDKDNKKSERMENVYQEVVDKADIVVGTQIVAKGHDLPRLSLVAMLLGDNSLDFPDYTSAERSYQLIKQLAGRVNRGHVKGKFLVQTFNPDSKLIKSAVSGDWKEFYDQEIKQRKQHGFPPFYSALKIETSKKSRAAAEHSLLELQKKIANEFKNINILGPYPSFIEKRSSSWHWQMILKSKNRSDLVAVAQSISGSFKLDIDPNNFL